MSQRCLFKSSAHKKYKGGSVNYFIENNPMQKWDIRFCELARYISVWSKDPNAKVGAVLFSKKGGNISIGYNGFPIGVEDSAERLTDKDIKLELVVHAEVNAIIASGARAEGATIYVWGKPICARCAGPIIQAGIKRVVALAPGNTDSHWDKSGITARDMFIEAGITVDFYTTSDAWLAQN
ncbi:dCMP deaminase family protein [Xanthomonas sacchari]|uniref:dCMP deaminase family protein n=1 Tax=Xanthomonas sacchari TaxID=56458 RepID=UPI00225DE407|nr:dCMP deaminase family protein [Xanthomonas sacchari]UYK80798.1 dCMP deaminase family protein [Xanthomonas sacchari]